jgi:DNA-binding NarL/FixJ family response regulator
MDQQRLLIVAGSPILRVGIRDLVESTLPVAETVEAENALDAVDALLTGPTLVILQDALPGVTGLAAAGIVRAYAPETCIAVLADEVDARRLSAARLHGADALLSLAIEPADFAAEIARLQGRRPVPALNRGHESRALFADIDTAPFDSIRVSEDESVLIPLEVAVLDGYVRGCPIAEIASRLRVAETAARRTLETLLRKFDACDRVSAMLSAARRGYVDRFANNPPTIAPYGEISFAVAP